MRKSIVDHNLSHPRLVRELKTIEAMIVIYCNAFHKPDIAPCRDCYSLVQYARKRLGLCPFQERKPTCGNCTIHCYQPEMRETIRKVMRYAGPRMIYSHPLMALRHLLDSRRKPPELARKTKSNVPPITSSDNTRRSN